LMSISYAYEWVISINYVVEKKNIRWNRASCVYILNWYSGPHWFWLYVKTVYQLISGLLEKCCGYIGVVAIQC
jgi:hypothetical protein